MRITGRLIGLLLGIIIFRNPFGALLGFFLGYLFDKNQHHFVKLQKKINEEQQITFFHSTFQVMGYLSKAKGRVTESDIQIATEAMNKMNLTKQERLEAQRAFRQGKAADYPLRLRLRQLRSLFSRRQDLLELFLETQIDMAFSDGVLRPTSRSILHIIADELGIDRQQFNRLLMMIENHKSFQFNQQFWQQSATQDPINPSLLDNAYKVLGVNASNSPAEIKHAYRKLMTQYHPDKLKAKGLPPEMVELAKGKAQDIQAAYDVIKRQQNFK